MQLSGLKKYQLHLIETRHPRCRHIHSFIYSFIHLRQQRGRKLERVEMEMSQLSQRTPNEFLICGTWLQFMQYEHKKTERAL